jgi:hypothetical protein
MFLSADTDSLIPALPNEATAISPAVTNTDPNSV